MGENGAVYDIDSEQIHKHSFWLYSVIVGLSVEEALRHVLPHVGELSFEMTVDQRLALGLELIRLALFLCLVVRFYLGSVRFYYVHHTCSTAHDDYKEKKYTWDFFIGLVHFSAFLALSLSIDSQRPSWEFMFWLSFIVLYDFLWWLVSRNFDTVPFVRWWAIFNGVCFMFSIALYFLINYLLADYNKQILSIARQTAFMIPIFIFSFIDLREVLSSEPVIERWVQKIVARRNK